MRHLLFLVVLDIGPRISCIRGGVTPPGSGSLLLWHENKHGRHEIADHMTDRQVKKKATSDTRRKSSSEPKLLIDSYIELPYSYVRNDMTNRGRFGRRSL